MDSSNKSATTAANNTNANVQRRFRAIQQTDTNIQALERSLDGIGMRMLQAEIRDDHVGMLQLHIRQSVSQGVLNAFHNYQQHSLNQLENLVNDESSEDGDDLTEAVTSLMSSVMTSQTTASRHDQAAQEWIDYQNITYRNN